MMTNPQETNTIATQTDEISNLGQGRQPLEEKEELNPIPELDYENTPNYLKQLHRLFGENFIAEATRNDQHSKNLLQIIEDKNWDSLKHFSRYWHSLKRDLSTTPAGCILYDRKMYIPTQLHKLIMNSIHRNHPGQSGMMHLANMIWFPRIHREIVTLTQNCQPCIKIDKRRGLKQPMLKADTMWNLESDSEPQLYIQFQPTIEEDDSSDQSTLHNIKKKAVKQKKQAKQFKQKDQLDRPEEPTNIIETHSYSQPGPSHQLDIPRPNNRNPPQRKRKQQPTKRSTTPKSDFERKSKEAAIAQSKLNKAKERQCQISNSPRIQMDTSKLEQNKSIEVINLISASSQGSPI